MNELPLVPGILFLLVIFIIITRIYREIAYYIGERVIMFFKYMREVFSE